MNGRSLKIRTTQSRVVGMTIPRLWFLFSISLLFAARSLSAAGTSSNSTDPEKLANELSQRLNALGSFKAEYEAIGFKKSAINITLVFNNQQKYCLLKYSSPSDQPEEVYMVSDFSRMEEKGYGWETLMISGKE